MSADDPRSDQVVPNLDPDSADLGPWRMHFGGWVTHLGGIAQPKPLPARQMAHFESDLEAVGFIAPSVAALHLNAAWKAALRASISKSQIKWNSSPLAFARFGMGSKAVHQADDASTDNLFDYFEDTMAAVMLSYSSLEAFCNTTIVEFLREPKPVMVGKREQILSAEEIEAQFSTERKLKHVVSEALGVPSPVDTPVWDRFVALKSLRDAITHFKRRDLTRPDAQATALHQLLRQRPEEAPETAMAVFAHFSKWRPLRWLQSPAWQSYADQCRELGGGQTGEGIPDRPES